MITICIKLIARPDKKIELEQVIKTVSKIIELENGCLGCRIYQNLDQANEYVVFEEWNDEAAARNHLQSDNLSVLSGAGSILTQEVSVSLDKYPSIAEIEKYYQKRIG